MGLSLDSDFQSGNHAMDLQSIVVDFSNYRQLLEMQDLDAVTHIEQVGMRFS